jgi:hypothetical protein
MDATTDKLSFTPIDLSTLNDLGPLDVSSNKRLTLAYSPGGHQFQLVDNNTEQVPGNPSTLPGSTESFFLAHNTLHIYAALPDVPTGGGVGTPGAVVQVQVSAGNITATIPVPHVRFIKEASRGDFILAFSDNSGGFCSPESGAVTIITAAKIGTSSDPRSQPLCFDHPVGAGVAADLLQPVILQCGAECGGADGPAIVPLNLNTGLPGTPILVPAATVAVGVNNVLYVAGTAPATACTSGTSATSCGTLTVVDLTGATAPKSFEIPDGYHDRMEVTTNGQIAIGSRDCTEISTSTEIRGCLAFFDPATSKVAIAAFNGNVTGLAAVPGRNVLYAIQGGTFVVYDTTTDKFLPDHQSRIVGELVDVKIIDNAP